MKNIEIDTKGSVMTIKVDVSKELGESSTGKSVIIATTAGGVEVNGVTVNLTVYKKKGRKS